MQVKNGGEIEVVNRGNLTTGVAIAINGHPVFLDADEARQVSRRINDILQSQAVNAFRDYMDDPHANLQGLLHDSVS